MIVWSEYKSKKEELKFFNYEFKTIIDEVSIELIGEEEKSIIIKNIKLGVLEWCQNYI